MTLTRDPASVTAGHIEHLRDAGLSDDAIHSVATVTAYFNFVNRLALGLDVELEAEFQTRPL